MWVRFHKNRSKIKRKLSIKVLQIGIRLWCKICINIIVSMLWDVYLSLRSMIMITWSYLLYEKKLREQINPNTINQAFHITNLYTDWQISVTSWHTTVSITLSTCCCIHWFLTRVLSASSCTVFSSTASWIASLPSSDIRDLTICKMLSERITLLPNRWIM